MDGDSGDGIVRNEQGRLSSLESSDQPISGPLGIWPWPILNLIAKRMNSSDRVVITEINRDSQGRIQSIEEFRK